ncbi:MAG: hypothetical protein Q8S46_04995 [Methylotenera sp.]|nr:hypothetical protein [Methylotenera sp.]MDP1755744.1 hypothetical protein [Methylotenera sp.]MDP1960035.1 hypothetical protein [Methylotenera sp.]MDP2280977.1 hypothetical protein [Methylotenera sp.]MDP3303494.1 hypothetical protein [Methylotenera sp.]
MNNITLHPNQIIDSEQLYSEAINIVLANAQRELLIFDQDLSRGGFASVEKYDLIQQFLSQNLTSQLTIILQQTAFFTEKCPRLFSLLNNYGHKMNVHVTNQSVKHAKDCFILADGQHYIKRIHIDQPRFKYALSDVASVKALDTRFKELKEAIQDVVSVKKLGL